MNIAPACVSQTAVITDHHRYIPGASGMFGGFGPHLGHLVRAKTSSGTGEALWLVDDYCAQSEPGLCDVYDDHTLAYYEWTASGWMSR